MKQPQYRTAEDVMPLVTALMEAKKREACEESLCTFVEEAWKVVESGTPFVHGWHIDAICQHLEALVTGDAPKRQLIINLPPRHMKSSIVAVMFPAWVWIKYPEKKFLFASYAESLSLRDSRKCRNLIRSPWYQKNWGDRFKIVSDQNEKRRFDNDKTGYRLATSVGGSNTGEGGDIICLPRDQLVLTEHGPVAIKDLVELQADVRVWSYNQESDKAELKPITGWFQNPPNSLVEITLDDGSILKSTPNHKIWTRNRGYVMARDLQPSDRLPNPSLLDGVDAVLGNPIPLGDISIAPFGANNLQGHFGGDLSPTSPAPLGGGDQSLSNSLPGSPVTNRVNDGQGDSVLRADIFCGQSFFGYLNGNFASNLASGAILQHGHRPVANGIGDILGASPVLQIEQMRVGAVAVEMPNLLSFGAWPDECSHHQYVNRFNGPAQIHNRIPLVEGMAHDAARDRDRDSVIANDDPMFAADRAAHSCAIAPLVSWDRSPVSVRDAGFADVTYCLSVDGNHNFFARDNHSIRYTIVSNCYDDPNNMAEINSDLIRTAANDWHDQTMVTRLNDPKTGIRVVIQQRGHQDDVTGHLCENEKGKWDLLVLPAEYEGPREPTSIGWVDPRSHVGELLWKERFGQQELEDLKRSLGPMGTAGQLQQRPAPAAGSIFPRQWWNFWNPAGTDTASVAVRNPGDEPIFKKPITIPSAFEQIVQSYDMAFKDEEQNDFVACHVWGRLGANVFLLHRKTERMSFPETLRTIRMISADYPCPEKLVEDKANGPAAIATLKNEIPGLIAITPEGGKESRAHAVAPYCESGNVFLPNPDLYPWVREFIETFAFFPRAKYDDDVDAATQALRRLFDSVSNTALPEFRVIPRNGEPNSACHVTPDAEMENEIKPLWRRWIAVEPAGAALWICETPKGSLRVYREMSLVGIDAHESGRRIAEASLPDIRAYLNSVHSTAKWNIDILMEKEAFAPIEPIGSYAELLEHGVLSYEPTSGSFDERLRTRRELKAARFSTNMAEVEPAVFDRLRELMRFKPVDFEPIQFERGKALSMRGDIEKLNAYMAASEGQVYGEWPRIKFGASLMNTVSSVGTAKKDDDITNPYLKALLVGICAPRSLMSTKEPVQINQSQLRRAV